MMVWGQPRTSREGALRLLGPWASGTWGEDWAALKQGVDFMSFP